MKCKFNLIVGIILLICLLVNININLPNKDIWSIALTIVGSANILFFWGVNSLKTKDNTQEVFNHENKN